MADYTYDFDRDRVTQRAGVRALPATLSEGIRLGEGGGTEMETIEQRAYRAAYAINNAHRMSTWYSGYRRPSGQQLTDLRDATVTVEATNDDSRGAPNDEGEYEQNSEGEVSIIFKVTFNDGEVLFLKKIGYTDSYGDNTNWDGPFRVGRPKTITVWE